MVIPQARELTESERKTGFTSIVFIRPAGRTAAFGVQTVDPTTGKGTGVISRLELERRRTVGGRKFRGELFVEVPPEAEIAASIRRTEEAKETRELAQKEAEFELKRISEGKIKAKDVVLTQRGSRAILTRLLQEQAQKELAERLKAPTTAEEFQRELERKQRIVVTLTKQQQIAREEARQKGALELFSEKAIRELGLGETKGGLLTITDEERKKIVAEGRVIADIPITAEFDKEFLSKIGIGFKEEELVGLKTPSGVLTFKSIVESLDVKLKPFTEELLRPRKEFFEEQLLGIKRELRKTPKGIRRFPLRTEQFLFGVELGVTKQIAEQPAETAIFLGTGAILSGGLQAFGLTKAPIVVKSSKALATLFGISVAAETGFQFGRGDIEAAGTVLGERTTEALAFITGGKIGVGVVQVVRPSKVKVLKAKELKTVLAETLETKGTSTKNLQRLGLRTEVRTRVTKVKGKIQLRRLKTPKDPAKLTKLLQDPNVRFEFRINPKTGQAEQVLVREIRVKSFRPKIAPEPFEIKIDGKLGLRVRDVTIRTDLFDIKVGDVIGVVDVKDLSRVIEPTLFKRISIKGLPKDVTVLQRDFISDIDKLPFDVRAELLGKGLITGKVKKVTKVADIFGINLFLPGLVTDFTAVKTRLGFKPILGVTTLFEPTPSLLFPTGLLDLFGRRRAREPIFDVTRDISKISGVTPITISESIAKQDVISELQQITEQRREGRRITKPVVDVVLEEVQLPIVDVIPKRKQEVAIDVVSISDLVTEQIIEKPPTTDIALLAGFPRKKKPKEIKKGKFEGYNAFVRGRKGRQLKVNLRRTLTKPSALSASARVVDNSIAATGSIKKVISKRPPLDTKDFYFQRNRDKFRTFRIRKGKRIPLKNKIIEKRGKRLDTRGEVKQITAARFLAQQRKKRQAITTGPLLELFPTRKKRKGVRFF